MVSWPTVLDGLFDREYHSIVEVSGLLGTCGSILLFQRERHPSVDDVLLRRGQSWPLRFRAVGELAQFLLCRAPDLMPNVSNTAPVRESVTKLSPVLPCPRHPASEQ
jgi:hypothetical protein